GVMCLCSAQGTCSTTIARIGPAGKTHRGRGGNTNVGPMDDRTATRAYPGRLTPAHPAGRGVGTAHVLSDHLDGPDNVAVELIKFVGRYPIFFMHVAAHAVDLVASEALLAYLEPRHEPAAARRAVLRVPLAGDLCRVLLIEDGIEDRLPGQSRRPGPIATLGNELQFFRSGRTIERDGGNHLLSLRIILFPSGLPCDQVQGL